MVVRRSGDADRILAWSGRVPRDQQRNVAAVYEDFRPGTWRQADRLTDMTLNHVDVAINYPDIFPRFCGQGFLERDDKDFALSAYASTTTG